MGPPLLAFNVVVVVVVSRLSNTVSVAVQVVWCAKKTQPQSHQCSVRSPLTIDCEVKLSKASATLHCINVQQGQYYNCPLL